MKLINQQPPTSSLFIRLIQKLIILAAALQMAPLPAQAQAIHRIGLPYNIFAGLFRLTDLHLDGSPDSSHGNAFPLNAASLTQAAPFNGTAHTPETPQGPASTAPALTTDLTDPTESILLAAIPEAETTSAFRFSPSEVTASASSFSGYGTTADNVPGLDMASPVLLAQASVPHAPANLKAAPDHGRVWLTWDSPTGPIPTGYEISSDGGANFTQQISDGSRRWTWVFGLTNGTTYNFVVRAVNDYGHGPSATVSATPISKAPNAPENLYATPNDGQVWLAWGAITGPTPTGYEISSDGGANFTRYNGAFRGRWISGLTNGTTYNFVVRAVNDYGHGPSSTVTATPLFSAPTNLTATAGDGDVVLHWSQATTKTNQSITGYQLKTNNGSFQTIPNSGSGGANRTSYTRTNLTNGTTYSFKVRAIHGRESTSVTAKPLFAALSGLTATAGDTEVTLSWDDPNDSSISGYKLSINGGTYSSISGSDATTTSHSVTGLTNGTSYSFAVRAENGKPPSSAVSAKPLFAPLTGLTATAADTEVSLSWDDPGDSSISGYELSIDGGTYSSISGSDATTTSHSVTGLTNGTSYSFAVRAENGKPPSSAVSAKPLFAPLTGLTATAGDTEVSLSWDDPNDSTISGYKLSINGGTYSSISGSDATTTSHSVTGLTNGTSYSFAVRAENGETATAVTATPLFDAPTNLTAIARDGEVLLSWDDPGNSSISGYALSIDNGAYNAITYTSDSDSDRHSHSVTGLTNGTSYSFSLRALNASSNGASATLSATPVTAPVAPSDLSATVGDSEITLSWSDPGNATISGYELSTDGGTSFSAISGSNASTTSHSVTGLSNGTSYSFALRAVNSAGKGASSTLSATPVALPLAPSNLSATAGDSEITLNWSDPGNATISGYELSTDGGTSFSAISGSDAGTTSHSVTGLSNGTSYSFALRAVNISGSGASATLSATPVPAPAAPSDLSATTGASGEIILSWSDPDNATISGYELSIEGGFSEGSGFGEGSSTFTAISGSDASTTSHSVTGLSNGTSYSFSLRAVNSAGKGASSTLSATPMLPVPLAPSDLSATAGDAEITLSWSDPGNATISGYELIRHGDNAFSAVSGSAASTTSHTVTGLTNGTTYSFAVRAVNTSGKGAFSMVSAAPLAVPDAPSNLTPFPRDTQLWLFWDDPDNDTITGYHISSDGGTTFRLHNANSVGALLTGLSNGITYTFAVRAVNGSGHGAWVTVSATPVAVPAAPSDLSVTTSHREATLSWSDPGNATISRYELSTDGGSTFSAISSSNASTTSHTVTGLTNGTPYTFALRAINGSGNSDAATLTATTPLWFAPTDLVAAVDKSRVVLQWTTGDPAIEKYLVRVKRASDNAAVSDQLVSASPGSGTTTIADVSSLANDTTYIFSVQAAEYPSENANFSDGIRITGMAASVTAMPAVARPAAPTNLSATSNRNRVTLSWDNPDNITIRKYQYSRDGGATFNHMNRSNRSTTSYTFKNLNYGTAYTLAVRASNRSGESTAASVTVTTLAVPATPTGLTATPGDKQVSLSWSDSADDTIIGYEVSSDGGETFSAISGSDASTTSHTVTGLTNATNYTFAVRAVNGAGNSAAATLTATTPLWSAPTNLVAAADNKRVVLQWDRGDPGIEKYLVRVERASDNHDLLDKLVSLSPKSETTTITDISSLANGTAYIFSVQAAESLSDSANFPGNIRITGMASSVTATPAVSRPAAPTNLSATPSNDRVRLSWDDPDNITIRKYQYSRDGGATFKHMNRSNRSTTSYTFKNLNYGTEYTLAVRGSNRSGESAAASVTVTTLAVPAAPTGLTATAGDGQVSLSWIDPDDDTITRYELSSDAGETFSAISGSDASTSSHTITGLTNGTTYRLALRAVNGSGNSAASSSVATTPIAKPDMPDNLQANPGDGEVTLFWDKSNDATIFEYVVTVINSDDERSSILPLSFFSNQAGDSNEVTIINKENDVEYTFELRAGNASGRSEAATVVATPIRVPAAAPTGLTATPGDGQVRLSWIDPDDDTITRYELSSDGGETFSAISGSDARTISHTVTGLINGTAYTFVLRPLNAAGNGGSSSLRATPLAVPAAPTNLMVFPVHTHVWLRWSDPDDTTISGYELSTNGGTSFHAIRDSDASTTSHKVVNLTSGTTYDFVVRALNASGSGAWSATASATPMFPVPEAPSQLGATVADGEIRLSWNDPGNATISGYELSIEGYFSEGGDISEGSSFSESSASFSAIRGSDASTTSHTITDLTNGTTYTLALRALNASGNGTSSTLSATPVAVPTAPRDLSATVGDSEITLSWSDPGNTTITGYELGIKDSSNEWGGSTFTSSISGSDASTTSHTITGLTNGATYRLALRAVNRSGNGAAATLNATPVALPLAPSGLSATAGDSEIRLRWNDPANPTISRYELSSDGGETFSAISGSDASTTSHTITNLSNGTTYTFVLRAVNTSGNGAAATLSATPTASVAGGQSGAGSGASVSNTGQTSNGQTSSQFPINVQGFTTGNHDKIILNSVELVAADSLVSFSDILTVEVSSDRVINSEILYTLNNPSNPVQGVNTFTAPAGAILNKNTEYFLFINVDNAELRWKRTGSNDEDSNSTSGWSIANSTTQYSSSNYKVISFHSLQIKVNATKNDFPKSSNKTVSTNEDITYTFSTEDFSFSDPDGDSLDFLKITTLPSADKGDLVFNNSSIKSSDLPKKVSRSALNGGKLKYIPPENANGDNFTSFNFKVNDGANDSSSAYRITVDLTAVNDAPTSADKQIAAIEDTEYTFKVSDFDFADIEGDTLDHVKIVSIPIKWPYYGFDEGTLKFNNISIRGLDLPQKVTKLQLQAGLLTYTPPANANGDAFTSVNFKVNDGDDNSDRYTITINLAGTSDKPTASDSVVNAVEDSEYIFKEADFNFSDTDGDVLDHLLIVGLPEESKGILSLNKIPISNIDLPKKVTNVEISGNVFRYSPPTDANGTGFTSFHFRVNDGMHESVLAHTITINLAANNDAAPTSSDNAVSMTEDDDYSFAATDFDFSDVDPEDELDHIKITTLPNIDKGTLWFDGTAIIRDQQVTKAELNDSKLTYTPANAASDYAAIFGFVVNDGKIDSKEYNFSMNVTADNDTPASADNVVSAFGNNSVYTFDKSDFNFSDPDGGTLDHVMITSLPGQGMLTLNNTVIVDSDLPRKVTNSQLDSSFLKYTRPASIDKSALVSFDFKVSDGSLDSKESTIIIDVTSDNQKPTSSNKFIEIFEDSIYVLKAADFPFKDVDGDSLDHVLIQSFVTCNNGMKIMHLNGIPVTFNQQITKTDIDNNKLIIIPCNRHSDYSLSFDFKVNDGTFFSYSNEHRLLFRVKANSNPPTATNSLVSAVENSVYIFKQSDFNFSDSEGDSLNHVMIASLPGGGKGTLTLNGTAITSSDLPKQVTSDELDSNSFSYTPPADASGKAYTTFYFKVNDGSKESRSAYRMSVDLAAVNSAPTARNRNVTTLEGMKYQFKVSDFGYSDSDGDTLDHLKITTLPGSGKGRLRFGYSDIKNSDLPRRVTKGELDAGRLTYIPLTNANTDNFISFNFKVNDGIIDSADSYTIDVNIRALAETYSPETTLVANSKQSNNDSFNTSYQRAQGFTTGDAPQGYDLGSIELTLTQISSTCGTLRVSVRESNAANLPGKTLYELTGPPTLKTGVQRFDAPDDAYLEPMTTYFIFISSCFADSSFDSDIRLQTTSSDGEDGDKATGWSINNNSLFDIFVIGTIWSSPPQAIKIRVNQEANIPPKGASKTVTTTEDIDYTFAAEDFGFWDANRSDNFAYSVKISSLPSQGTLSLDGTTITDVTTPLQVSKADLDDNKLTYTPVNASRNYSSSFNFKVNDGTVDSKSMYSIDIDVTATQELPMASDRTISIDASKNYSLTVADFGFIDSDGDRLDHVIITTLPSAGPGMLKLDNTTIESDDLPKQVTAAKLRQGKLKYHPLSNTTGFGVTIFNFKVNDGKNDSASEYSMSVDLLPLISGPELIDYRDGSVAALETYTAAGTPIWSLAGDDSDAFSISSDGVLSFVSTPDIDSPDDVNADNVYAVSVVATANGFIDMLDVNINVYRLLDIIGDDRIDYAENSTEALQTYSVSGSRSVTWSLQQSNDYAAFSIDSSSGELSFVDSPDFENPVDGNINNMYVLYVLANGNSVRAKQKIIVKVKNVAEDHVWSSGETLNQTEIYYAEGGSSALGTYMATDPDGDSITYALASASGDQEAAGDHNAFNLDANTGVLTFKSSPNYDNPVDIDTDNVYLFQVLAFSTDVSISLDVSVTIDRLPIWSGPTSFTMPEDAIFTDYRTLTLRDPDGELDPSVAPNRYLRMVRKPQGDHTDDQDYFRSIPSNKVNRFADDNVGISFCPDCKNSVTGEKLATPDYDYPVDADKDNIYKLKLVAYNEAVIDSFVAVPITISLTNVYDEPVANNDFFSIYENTTIDISVDTLLANDLVDIEAGSLSLNTLGMPSHGTARFDAETNIITYIPNVNFAGIDTFSYTIFDDITDENGAPQPGVDSGTVSIEVVRPQDNAGLSDLSISTCSWDCSVATQLSGFSSDTTNYEMDVPWSIKKVKLIPTAAHSNATVTVNGKPLKNNNISSAIQLKQYNPTEIKILVTAEDGITTKTYTITLFHQAAGPNIQIKQKISGGFPWLNKRVRNSFHCMPSSLDENPCPSELELIYYNAYEIDSNIVQIRTPDTETAYYMHETLPDTGNAFPTNRTTAVTTENQFSGLSEEIELIPGMVNNIWVSNGSYNSVTRINSCFDRSITLTDSVTNPVTLKQDISETTGFTASVMEYNADVPAKAHGVTVTPTSSPFCNPIIKVNGKTVISGSVSEVIDLKPGEVNSIPVEFKFQHGNHTIKTNYNFNVKRAASAPAAASASIPSASGPSFGGQIIDDQVYMENLAIEDLILPQAQTTDDSQLTYSLTPALPAGLALVENDGLGRNAISGTPKLYHKKQKYTWTATDADGETASLSFSITVQLSPAEKKSIRAALSGQARALLGSVTSMIAERLNSGVQAGSNIPGRLCRSSTAAADGISGADNGYDGIDAAHGTDHGNGDHIVANNGWNADPYGTELRGVPHLGRGDHDGMGDPGSAMGSTFDDLLTLVRVRMLGLVPGRPYSLHPDDWAPGCEDDPIEGIRKDWTLWAAVDQQWARGGTGSSDFDGAWQFLYLGADRSFGDRWLAGLSLSRVWGELDYSFNDASSSLSGAGELSSGLTAFYPYVHGQLTSNLELWAIAGIGFGDVENEREHVDGHRDQGDLSMGLAALGLRRSLSPTGSAVDLSLTSDAGFVALAAEGDGSLDGAEASIGRLRLGLEVARPFASGAEPFAQLHGRYDSGDGPTGAAGEMVLGLRYADDRLNLELRGNYLASAAEFEQWGANARLDYGPAADSTGLNLSLDTRWGAAENGGSFLQGHTIGLPAEAAGDNIPVRFSGEIGYGLAIERLPGSITPNLGYDHSGHGSSRTRVGLAYALSNDLNRDIELRLDLARSEQLQDDPDHSIELSTTLRF